MRHLAEFHRSPLRPDSTGCETVASIPAFLSVAQTGQSQIRPGNALGSVRMSIPEPGRGETSLGLCPAPPGLEVGLTSRSQRDCPEVLPRPSYAVGQALTFQTYVRLGSWANMGGRCRDLIRARSAVSESDLPCRNPLAGARLVGTEFTNPGP